MREFEDPYYLALVMLEGALELRRNATDGSEENTRRTCERSARRNGL